ncbi:MAG TPA: hypothetical protein VFF24_16275 [Acidimicrobiia bacterium]|nr:hypothetical protein [Acidimicrobiia bacterium]
MSRRNAGACVAGNLIAALIVTAAWIGASGATTLRAQVPYLNLGVIGLLVAAFANATLLAQAQRDIDARTRRVLGRFDPGPTEP